MTNIVFLYTLVPTFYLAQMLLAAPTSSTSGSLMNKLLVAIILAAFLVLGLAIYSSFGGSKVNLSNTFLPYYGQLFGYDVGPSRKVLKVIESTSATQALNIPDSARVIIEKSPDSSSILVKVFNDGNPIPTQSQTWNLVNATKNLDLDSDQFWFYGKTALNRVTFNNQIPQKISSGNLSLTLTPPKADELPSNITLSNLKYWPENNQLWSLYKIDESKSLVVGWNLENGKLINMFKIPSSRQIFFTDDNNTLIFSSSDNLNLFFYTPEGLEKFNKTIPGKLETVEHFDGRNYIVFDTSEKISVNLSKLTSLNKDVVKVQIWDKDFVQDQKLFSTSHSLPIVLFTPIDGTNYVLAAGEDAKITLLDISKGTTVEEYPVDSTRDNKMIVGGYLDKVSNQLILIYKDGDVDFYQVLKV